MKQLMALAIAGLILSVANYGYAEDAQQSVKESAQDAGRAVKKGAHRVEEKGCEMVDGKMQCLGKKAKNRATEVKDKVEDSTSSK